MESRESALLCLILQRKVSILREILAEIVRDVSGGLVGSKRALLRQLREITLERRKSEKKLFLGSQVIDKPELQMLYDQRDALAKRLRETKNSRKPEQLFKKQRKRGPLISTMEEDNEAI